MAIHLYAREYYLRSRTRYIIAGVAFCALVLLTLWSGIFFAPQPTWIPGWQSWVSVMVLIVFALAYWKLIGSKVPDIIEAHIIPEGLVLGNQQYAWSALEGFAVEVEGETGNAHNLIICTSEHRMVMTFADTQQNILPFLLELQGYTQQLEKVPYSTLEIVLRRCKI